MIYKYLLLFLLLNFNFSEEKDNNFSETLDKLWSKGINFFNKNTAIIFIGGFFIILIVLTVNLIKKIATFIIEKKLEKENEKILTNSLIHKIFKNKAVDNHQLRQAVKNIHNIKKSDLK